MMTSRVQLLIAALVFTGCVVSKPPEVEEFESLPGKPDSLIISNDSAYTKSNFSRWQSLPANWRVTELPVDFAPYDQEPIARRRVYAHYPQLARSQNIKGTVYIKLAIDTLGLPILATVLRSPNRILNDPALIAVMYWQFTPAIYNGKKVPVWVSLPMRFPSE